MTRKTKLPLLDPTIARSESSSLVILFVTSLLFHLSKAARKLVQNEIVQGAVLLCGLLLIFFSTPLLHLQDRYYFQADISQIYTLTNLNQAHSPLPLTLTNIGVIDPAYPIFADPYQILQPWLLFNRSNIQAGKLPLWNPYNGNGVPHLANYQSAVFSPYSLPFYILNFQQALVASAFLKLFTLGFFTFLFLKQLKLRQAAALLGAITFMFSGYNIVWLAWPLSGTVVALPASLYFVERTFCQVEERNKYRDKAAKYYLGSFVGLSLSMATGLLAGHPETFYACFLLIAAYIVFRLLDLWRQQGFCFKGSMTILSLGLQFSLAGIVGVGLAAVQLLPFFEYLGQSTISRQRGEMWRYVLPSEVWPVFFFPNLMGNPSSTFKTSVLLPPPNFSETTSLYSGGLVLFLALVALVVAWRNKYVGFFGMAGLLWLVYATNLFNIRQLLLLIPDFESLVFTRSAAIWLFSLSCCAALLMHQLSTKKFQQKRTLTLSLALAGLAFLTLNLLGAQELVKEFYNQLQSYSNSLIDYLPGHLWFIGLSFGAGLLATLMLQVSQKKWMGALLLIIVTACIFLQSGYLLKDFNPTIGDQAFYPVTPAIRQLQQILNGQNVAILGYDAFPPDSNMVYHISIPNSYDGIWIKNYEELLNEFFEQDFTDYQGMQGPHFISKVSEAGLKLFGVNYVVTIGDNKEVDTTLALTGLLAKATKNYPIGEILPGQEINQTFKASQPGLQQVEILLATYARTNHCNLNFRLEEVGANKIITQRSLQCDELKDNNWQTFTFPSVSNSLGKEYRIVLSSSDAKSGNAVTAWAASDLVYPDGSLELGGQKLSGNLRFNFGYSTNAFEPVVKAKNYTIYRYKEGLPPYYTVSRAQIVGTEEKAKELVRNPEFDPAQSVVLLQNVTQAQTKVSQQEQSQVQVLAEEASYLQLKITRQQPGYLILDRTFYPGWKAKVNGIEKPVLQANVAFSAIEVGTGDSLVEYYYEPNSVKYGAFISLASLIICSSLLLLSLFFRIREKHKSDKPNFSF